MDDALPVRPGPQDFSIDLGFSTKSLKIASFLEDVHRAYGAFEGAATLKQVTCNLALRKPAFANYLQYAR